MGANNQRSLEVWLIVQKNSKQSKNELFDVSKKRILDCSYKALFPSYLNYNQTSKELTYSLIQNKNLKLCKLDIQSQSNQLQLTYYSGRNQHKIWKLIREDESVELQEGDTIKFGRIQLNLKQLKTSGKKSLKNISNKIEESRNFGSLHRKQNSINLLNSDNFGHSRMKQSDIFSVGYENGMKNSMVTQKSINEKCCRFCFDSSSNKINPLFSVCKCMGSIKNVHYFCLKNWVQRKMERIQTSHCLYYHYEDLTCQLCKSFIGNEINYEGILYYLYQPQNIYPPFARFQHINQGKKYQILIRLEESLPIQIGRGNENQLNLNDLSISRSHSSLFYTSRKLFLRCKNSKYGTFIQLNRSIDLKQKEPIQLLIQNNLVSIDRKFQELNFFEQQCCSIQIAQKLIVIKQ